MMSLKQTPLGALVRDERGSFTTTFSLISPVLLIAVAAAISYSQMLALQQRTQAAADSAALAATIAMSNSIKNGAGMTSAQAQAVAAQYFKSNAPGDVIASQSAAVQPVTTVSNNVVTTTINYQANPPTLVSGVFGSSASFRVAASATSTATQSKAAAVGTLTGSGWIAEDPVVQAANGVTFMTMCDQTHATWYNLLSDSGIEVNSNCDGTPNWTELYQLNFMLGSHVVSVIPTLQYVNWYGTPINREIWYGAVTVDGQSFAAPTVAGTTTVLNDAAKQITAQIVIGQPLVRASAANYLLVKTPNYSITLAYDSDNNGIDLGFGDLQISAKNAGACSSPGGIWGQTLTNKLDQNTAHFVVASPTATAPEFSLFCGAVAGATTKAKLIQ